MDFIYDEHFELTILSQQMLAVSTLAAVKNFSDTDKVLLGKVVSLEADGVFATIFAAINKTIKYVATVIMLGMMALGTLLADLISKIVSLPKLLIGKGNDPKETKIKINSKADEAYVKTFSQMSSELANLQKTCTGSYVKMEGGVKRFISKLRTEQLAPEILESLIDHQTLELENQLKESGFKSKERSSKGETITTYYYGGVEKAHKLEVRKKKNRLIAIALKKGPKVASINGAPNKTTLKQFLNDVQKMENELGKLKVSAVEKTIQKTIDHAATMDDLPKESVGLLADLANLVGISRRYQHIMMEIIVDAVGTSGNLAKACIDNLEDA